MSDAVGTEAPDFVHLGIPAINVSDKFNTFGTPSTRVRRLNNGYRWSASVHVFGEATAAGMSGTRSEQKFSYKTDFEIRRENQEFGRQNNSMSRPTLYSNPIGTDKTNITTSPIDSIPVSTKIPDPTPRTQLMKSPT